MFQFCCVVLVLILLRFSSHARYCINLWHNLELKRSIIGRYNFVTLNWNASWQKFLFLSCFLQVENSNLLLNSVCLRSILQRSWSGSPIALSKFVCIYPGLVCYVLPPFSEEGKGRSSCPFWKWMLTADFPFVNVKISVLAANSSKMFMTKSCDFLDLTPLPSFWDLCAINSPFFGGSVCLNYQLIFLKSYILAIGYSQIF